MSIFIETQSFIIFLLSIYFFETNLFLVVFFNSWDKSTKVALLKERVFIDTANQINIDFKKFEINLFSIQHQVIYQTSYKIIKDNLLVGIGPKMFREICKNEKYKTYTELDKSIDGCQTHSHNSYIQVLTETGIFGFIFLILIYFFISYQLFIKFLNSKKILMIMR